MNHLEVVAVVFGLVGLMLTVRQNLWCWPVSLVSVSAFLLVFARARLYADAALQVFYISISVYGWYHWLRPGPEKTKLPVTRLRKAQALVLAAIWVAGAAAFGTALSRHTDAAVPYWNSATAVASVIAQFLLARKVLENWLIWIATDVVMIGIYLTRGLYLTGALYAAFLLLSVQGYIAWRKDVVTPTGSEAIA